ncbi:MAG: hypothetical protein IK127_05715 [Clostridia bacterium]|nr:hypothetical protein [Clostridia bacterium]
MNSKNRKLSLVLIFMTSALAIALCLTLAGRLNDGQQKVASLKAEADRLLNGETNSVEAINNQKTVLENEWDALANEKKNLEQQIKEDQNSIARDKENIDELADLYTQLDVATLRTEVWQTATEILTEDSTILQNVSAVIGAVETGIITPEEALEQLLAMKPDTNESPEEMPAE